MKASAFDDYERFDGVGLAALVRSGQVHATELVEAAIARIESRNPALNAVIVPMYEQAREAARRHSGVGPLAGVPLLVKDLVAAVEGVPTGSGYRLLRTIPWPHDSELVRRLRAAGTVLLGKTNTPEFGLAPYTEPETFGPTRNPWDLSRSPGGSSGGSAAAVAAGMVPVATGGDGAGSIRIPASCCGLFGLKVSRGRTPCADFEPTTYTLGLLGRATPASDYALAVDRLQLAARNVAAFFEHYPVLLTPTLAQPPIENQPAMSVPLHWNDAGLPIGVQFVGRFGDEATLLRLAGQLERARPWADRRPPVRKLRE